MVATRRIIVIEDDDLISAIQNDEATVDDITEYSDADDVVSYDLLVAIDLDASFVCRAVGIEPTDEHELADGDDVVYVWDTAAAEHARRECKARLAEPRAIAEVLCRAARDELEGDGGDVDDVLDVLEQADRRYQPGPEADPSISAAALLMRLMSAFRAATRRDAWVLAI